MEGFYSDAGKTKVKNDLFEETAEKIANDIVGASKSQVRRLYNEVKRFDRRLDGDPEKWEKNYPYIKKIISIVSYNVARAIEKNKSEAKAYINLSNFILNYIKLVKDEKDYHVFTALFEAVYGFYYKETIKKEMERRN